MKKWWEDMWEKANYMSYTDSYRLQAQNTFILFITFDMQDLFRQFLITSVAQLELNCNMLLMAPAVVSHVYFTKTCFTLEQSSWTWIMGQTSEVSWNCQCLQQCCTSSYWQSLLWPLLYFQVTIVEMTLPFLAKHSHTVQTTHTEAHARVWCRTNSVPHSFCRSVLVVAVQLGDTQHGLSEHSKEAQCFHKEGGVQPQVSDVTSHTSEGEDALHVVCKLAPMPKIVQVKICNRTGMQEESHMFSQPTQS